jgi:hypothetical protein
LDPDTKKISDPAGAPVELQFLKLVSLRQCCPNSNFSIPDPRSRVKKIADLGSAKKNLNIFNDKKFF